MAPDIAKSSSLNDIARILFVELLPFASAPLLKIHWRAKPITFSENNVYIKWF